MKRSHNLGIGQRRKPTLDEFSLPPLKYMAWEKASNLRQLIEDGRQSEARNFERAQHIDKRLSYVSSRINALQKVPNSGPSPKGFFCKMIGQKLACLVQ